MCIVIDLNAFHSVFDPSVVDHNEFKPVLDWIVKKDGKLIYGGTKYKLELSKLLRYVPLLNRLKEMGKVVSLNDELIDDEEKRLEKTVAKVDFDDPHIVAILIISRVKLLCTKDSRSDKYVLDKKLYPKGMKKPHIYRNSSHRHLLNKKNISKVCMER